MSHALTERSNGSIEMAYRGATPWHGLGQSLEAGQSIEQWIDAAGMDWNICRSRVRYGAADAPRIIEDQHVLFRSDTKDALGIVSNKFKIVQPREVLEFFRDLTEDAGFQLETAGTMFGGRRFWALAHIGESAVIRNAADMVGGYLLLCTGADGTLATTARFTTVRVVCNNTLGMALHGKAAREAKMTHRSVFDPARMKDELGIARDSFSAWVRTMCALATEDCDIGKAEALTFKLMTDKDWHNASQEERGVTATTNGFKKILALFSGEGQGANMSGVSGTAWGWLNAVTEYTDHHVRARSVDNRLDSAWFGNGDKLKTKALDLLTA